MGSQRAHARKAASSRHPRDITFYPGVLNQAVNLPRKLLFRLSFDFRDSAANISYTEGLQNLLPFAGLHDTRRVEVLAKNMLRLGTQCGFGAWSKRSLPAD